MRITARGWSRNAGTTVLCDRDLKDATQRLRLWPTAGVHMGRLSGGIRLQVGPQSLTLGGRYEVSVELTTEDIVRLFLRRFPDLAAIAEQIYIPAVEDEEIEEEVEEDEEIEEEVEEEAGDE
jgi:hypothetical protein